MKGSLFWFTLITDGNWKHYNKSIIRIELNPVYYNINATRDTVCKWKTNII